jgi:hypothetical protein
MIREEDGEEDGAKKAEEEGDVGRGGCGGKKKRE